MRTVTSSETQNRFGELIDGVQREPVTITRRGRPPRVRPFAEGFGVLSCIASTAGACARGIRSVFCVG